MCGGRKEKQSSIWEDSVASIPYLSMFHVSEDINPEYDILPVCRGMQKCGSGLTMWIRLVICRGCFKGRYEKVFEGGQTGNEGSSRIISIIRFASI